MTEENQRALDFENWPPGELRDETDIGLRAYITRIPEEQLACYDSSWSDEAVAQWDGNFKSDPEDIARILKNHLGDIF